MGLKLLFAGCSKAEREHAETAVRQALGEKVEGGAWTVSLVKLAGQWSVSVDEPSSGPRALTFVTPLGLLREAITKVLDATAPPQAPQARSAETRNACRCGKCGGAFLVSYEAVPGEGDESVPVACPHCWQVNHVLVAESAAEARDYRAEKA